jgi:hypothetical protein
MAHSEDAGEDPVPPAPILQRRQSEAGFSQRRFGRERAAAAAAAAAQDPASSDSATTLHHGGQNELLITSTTEFDENVHVPKSRPLGRRASSRRSMMVSSSLFSPGGMLASSSSSQNQNHNHNQAAVSRSSSGTSNGGTSRRGSVILAQLRAATAAGFIRGADSNDDDDDRLIDLAVNAVMKEPDITTEASIMMGVRRNVSSSSVNSRVSRASSVRSKEPDSSLLESRFAGVRLKSAPSSTAAKKVPPTAMETHEASLGDSASSLNAQEAALLASNVPSPDDSGSSFPRQALLSTTTGPSNNKSHHDVETSEYVSPGGNSGGSGGEAERPGLGERQPSWMRDALEQMSAGDVEAFLNESHSTVNAGAAAAATSTAASASNQNQNHLLVDDTEVLEQCRIIAHHEARQRVKENLGYDPIERAEEEQLSSGGGKKLSSGGGGGGGGSGGDGKKESILSEVTLPPMCPPAVIPAAKVGMCLPKESLPISRFLALTTTPRQPELCKGQIGSTGSSNRSSLVDCSREIQIVARCLGCRSHLQVPIHATLVHCPQCSTISPATSTR